MSGGHERLAPEQYARHWAVFWCLVAALAAWAAIASREPSFPLNVPQAAPAQGVEWFLVVKIPEATSEDIPIDTTRAQFAGWLQALERAGFRPMALSTVLAWLDQGRPLPQKTLVLLFRPGYRRTYEVLAPVLAEHGYPAVWLTDRDALRRGDHRYLSSHAIRKMRASKRWDLAWFDGRSVLPGQKTLAVELEGAGSGQPLRGLTLSPQIGDVALNTREATGVLRQLNVHPTWTTQELVDRLLVEAPVEGPSHLTARQIGVRPWGVAISADGMERPQAFTLRASLQGRVASVSWPSTKGKNDFQLYLQIPSGMGDVWVLLRSDRVTRQGVRLGFVDGGFVVEQELNGRRTRLTAVARPGATATPLKATMVLIGDHLELSVDDQPAVHVALHTAPPQSSGMVEFVVADRVRGAAVVQSARVLFAPFSRTQAVANKPQPAGPVQL